MTPPYTLTAESVIVTVTVNGKAYTGTFHRADVAELTGAEWDEWALLANVAAFDPEREQDYDASTEIADTFRPALDAAHRHLVETTP